ncbi:MAG: NAD(P)/FAD-dependent oxidoreductase [Beijerinckiaceae bacterium]
MQRIHMRLHAAPAGAAAPRPIWLRIDVNKPAQVFMHVVIIGGAAMGSSTACHLLMDAGFAGTVTVIEQDLTYARSATALSAASIRQQYSTAVNVAASLYGITFMRTIGAHMAVNGEMPAIGLRENGYLYLATDTGANVLRANNALQTSMGADTVLLKPDEIKTRFPWIDTDDLALGSWGRTGEGWFDGWGLLQAYRNKARALGVVYREGKVAGLDRSGTRITAVQLADGTHITGDVFVNCAGASGGRAVAAMAGIDIPVYAKKRCVFAFTCKEKMERAPLMIDISGVWCRPEGDGFIGGYSPDDENTGDAGSDFDVNWSEWDDVVWPALAARVPAFEAVKTGRAWAGHYDLNIFDHNAIVGLTPHADNFYLCNGYSGHGLQQSPAVGRGLAELIVHGTYRSLDLSDFAFDRIAANQPLLEKNVI